MDKEAQKKDIFICNCKKEDQHMSTHYCDECDEGFCRFCVKAHRRFLKVMQVHNLLQINYYCKCQTEEKKLQKDLNNNSPHLGYRLHSK